MSNGEGLSATYAVAVWPPRGGSASSQPDHVWRPARYRRRVEWVSVVTAVLGFLGGNGWSRLRIAGRLRQQLLEEVELLDRLPEGPTKVELEAHVQARVRLLVAEQEGHTASERLTIRWAVAFVMSGFTVLIALMAGVIGNDSPWVRWPVGLIALGFLVYGMHAGMSAHEARTQRRWVKRQQAESVGHADA